MPRETHRITIIMTDHPPIRIVSENWPLIARGEYLMFEGEFESQSSRTTEATMRVRQHMDSERYIVYAEYSYVSHWALERNKNFCAGIYVTDPPNGIIPLISTVARIMENSGQVPDGISAEIRKDCIDNITPINID